MLLSYMLILYHVMNVVRSIYAHSFLVEYLSISMYNIISSANNEELIAYLQIGCSFNLLFCLEALAVISVP